LQSLGEKAFPQGESPGETLTCGIASETTSAVQGRLGSLSQEGKIHEEKEKKEKNEDRYLQGKKAQPGKSGPRKGVGKPARRKVKDMRGLNGRPQKKKTREMYRAQGPVAPG